MMLVPVAAEGLTFALDGSSRAPNRATTSAFRNFRRERRRGHRATTVPSSPAVYDYAVGCYGRLSAAEVLQPAVRLASDGYRVSELQETLTRRELIHRRGRPAPRRCRRRTDPMSGCHPSADSAPGSIRGGDPYGSPTSGLSR